MTASVGQNLPGAPLQRSGSQQSGGKADEGGPAFDDLLTHHGASGKDKTPHGATHSPHWEKIRADFTFGNGERTAAQVEKSKARIDEQDGDEQADDKQPTDTRDRLPLFMNLHDLGRSQPDNQEIRAESELAETAADPLTDKAKRAAVARQATGRDDSQGDSEQSPTIHVDRSAARRGAGGIQPETQAEAQNLIADKSAADAIASPTSAVGEAQLGGSGTTLAEALGTETNGRRASSEILKQSGASRASVVTEQNYPAPALQNASQAARDVIDAIAGNGAPAGTASAAAMSAQSGPPVAVPAHILKIELHPAELGAVTANLRLSGEQLSIELKPETYEAHRRLISDSEAIVKSLKSLGFDIDKVTILQPSIAATPAARADASQAGSPPGRDQSSFQPGSSGGNGDGMSGQSGRNRGDDRQQDQRPAQPSPERSSSGLFI